ncbi:peroxisomal biogenesis factor 11 [Mycena rosella]|uniref:Peroxisomal biogenesis factor 11 n=1 Tax=Mycena rosella TaxID=1033263 RepID=A0AAD7GV65_MYCRO|nr:peroxisomal biogenesis factor 11 [Mycena rosella]
MASVASQLVLHPAVSQSIKVGATTLGRDKAYRAVQNFARFYAWFLISRGYKVDAARWTALKSHLGTARKLLRLGKPMEHLQAALRAALTSGPPAEQITTIARQVAYFLYLTFDTFSWAQSIKFAHFHPDTAARIGKLANRSWLAGILLSIAHAAIKTARLSRETKLLKVQQHHGEKDIGLEADREAKLRAFATTRAAIRHQFIIDFLDLWNPATSLGFSNLNDGVVGMFGLISSLMALEKHWQALGGKK